MHGYVDEIGYLRDVSGFLAGWYLTASLANAWAGYRADAFGARPAGPSTVTRPFTGRPLWYALALVTLVMAGAAWSGHPDAIRWMSIPESLRSAFDALLSPTLFVLGMCGGFLLFFLLRRFFTRPTVAWGGLNLAVLFLGLSLTDPDFGAIVAKPDNVPIVGMVFLLGFFLWLSARRAVLNDERARHGLTPLEGEDNEKVLVWPDLVYIELICMVALTALLLVWSIAVPAPLEAPASTVVTPNPSKAPWYFLGLQEMLVYFDPWMAGVVLPGLIIVGLMAVPYIDKNPRGNGYYTIDERRFAYLTFQFGFLLLWITLMLMGTFFRGPNWSFFGFYETWDVHKVEVLNNITLAERFWIGWLERPLPTTQATGGWGRLALVAYRESPGLTLLAVYYLLLPPLSVRYSRLVRDWYLQMGAVRFAVTCFLWLTMWLLPIKMICRWSLNLSYFVSIPELTFHL